MGRRTFQRLLKLPVLLQPRPGPSHRSPSAAFFCQSHRPVYQHQPYRYSPARYPPAFGPSRTVRFLRSLLWATLFSMVGVYAGVGYLKGVYRGQTRVKLGSLADIGIAAEIMTEMDQHPSVQALKADPDFEEIWPLATNAEQTEKMKTTTDGKDIHHLVYTAFRGSRGVFPRAFYNRSRHILVMVAACSYGCEGEYGHLHNGAIETLIQESIRILAQFWFPPDMTYKLSELYVAFGEITHPNTIWCITCMPLATVGNLAEVVDEAKTAESRGQWSNVWPDWFNPRDWNQMTSSIVATVSPLDGHPIKQPQQATANAVGHFQVEDSEDWPPAPPPHKESFYGWSSREQSQEANPPNDSEEG